MEELKVLVGHVDSVRSEMRPGETGPCWGDTRACPEPPRAAWSTAPCPRGHGEALLASRGRGSHPGELQLEGKEPLGGRLRCPLVLAGLRENT